MNKVKSQRYGYTPPPVAHYHYSGLGHRVAKEIGNLDSTNPTSHREDVLDLTKDYNNLLQRQVGSTNTTYIWDSDILFAKSKEDTNTYLTDYLGSPLRFGDDPFAFDEFGQILSGSFTNSQPFTFTGYQQDSIANTYYGQAREYMPKNARFVSEDIVKGNVAVPQTQNVYSYCYSAPLAFVDRDGKTPTIPSVGHHQGFTPIGFVESRGKPSVSSANPSNPFLQNIARRALSATTVRIVDEEPLGRNSVVQTSSYADSKNTLTTNIISNYEARTIQAELQLNTPTITIPSTSITVTPHINISTDGKISPGHTVTNLNTGTTMGLSKYFSKQGVGATAYLGAVDSEGNQMVGKITTDPISWKYVAAAVVGGAAVVALIALLAIFAPVTVPAGAGAAKVGGGATVVGGAAKSGGGATALGGTLQQAFAALMASTTFSNNTSCPGRNR